MKILCPNKLHCNSNNIIKFGNYYRKCDSTYIQKYKCKDCKKIFSKSTNSLNYKHKNRRSIHMIRHLLCSGVSMRRIAKILKIHRITVKRKLEYLNLKAEYNQKIFLKKISKTPVEEVQLDDLITIEHTKLKPLSVTVAVNKKTREFLGVEVSRIPAFGHLAHKSVVKYGYRKSELKNGINKLFKNLEGVISNDAVFESDEHKLYPGFIKAYFPNARHKTYKGDPSSVAGLGELKKNFRDPLFTINHSLAMLRANINRLIRRTWCTTKLPSMLQFHLNIYIEYHNSFLLKK